MTTRETASLQISVDRRGFLKLLGGGLLVCLSPSSALAQESGRGFRGHELPNDVSAWIHIGADGRVKVFTGKVEVGQNIRTSLAQAVAEELRVPFESITMVMGDTDLVPWDMGTFGSRTTPTMSPQLRNMAVAARELLVEAAAKRWNIDPSKLTASAGKITTPDGQKFITYGNLTRGEDLVKSAPGDPPLTPATEWKIAGTPVPKANGHDFVTGKHQFPSDIVRPGMAFGAVLRPEGYNAKLDSIETTAAEKLPGVKVIRDGDFTGVVAEDAFTAHQAVEAIKAKWTMPSQPSNQGLFDYLKANPDGESKPDHQSGSVADAYSSGDVKLESRYTTEYIAHTPLEPRAAVAEWNDGKLTVWTGTQRPFGVHEELMQTFKLSPKQVRVIQPDMGSGYGGKHTGEAAIEAARLARAAGKPVKVVWTREEEFTCAYFRPAGLVEIKSAARKDGTLVSWEFHNYNSGPAGIETPYETPNQLIQFHPSKSPLRQGSYRGLAATFNHFARESQIDEMAHALHMDPVAFRLKNISNPRLRAVVRAAAEKFEWDSAKSSPERGFGLSCGTDKGGFVATCAEIAVNPSTKNVKVQRAVQAWECGAIVNPDGLRNQVQGALVQGIGGALFERILFSNGRIENPHLSKYRVPRFSDTPQIDIILLDRKDLPSAGAGETGIVGIAPAIGNAIFAATGTRLRHMPLTPEDNVVKS
ncbi:xanthine dehydrogenase family protein molybdopterin-binding subunit [Occallatibacter savannae]|uniref:xanthine dehydrogenase family protein molybdopterin-binding subunit n=1 Tax=Occallatibacter savannae TaxID=1002691 RepID=UPI000D68BA32|nr:molybdopterin cofactor-binding domain-containing protein [Occallatibacter savannae]